MAKPTKRLVVVPALVLGCWIAAFIGAVSADERPTPLASHRYLSGEQALDAAAEQEAQAYRSRLAGERLRLERRGSDSSRSPAVLLRRQGEVNREIDRVEELLNR